MNGMKTFTLGLLLLATVTALGMVAMFYSVHDTVYLAWTIGAGIVALVALYGAGYFSGWLAAHEEKRTIYRHGSED